MDFAGGGGKNKAFAEFPAPAGNGEAEFFPTTARRKIQRQDVRGESAHGAGPRPFLRSQKPEGRREDRRQTALTAGDAVSSRGRKIEKESI